MVIRGDVWLVDLAPAGSSEVRRSRPCVVVSPSELNDHLKTVIVAPMASRGGHAPFRIPLTFQGAVSLVLLDQLRTIDKSRLIQKLGRMQSKTLQSTLLKLQEMFEV